MSCSATKVETDVDLPAQDLYDGPGWRLLRRFAADYPQAARALHVYVVSAEYGLLRADAVIETYERRMDADRAAKLAARGADHDMLGAALFMAGDPEVLVFGGKLYASVASAWMPHDYMYRCVCDGSRGIGDQLGELRAWLYRDINLADNVNQLQLVGNA
jgi:hypothetical protein